jgi:predicted permease
MKTTWGRFGRRSREDDLDRELRFQLDEHERDLVGRGMDPAEARRQARLFLGGLDQVKEGCRDARGTRWLRDIGQDARYTLRMFRHSPGFTAVALLTLALGTAIATVMFTVINSVLLRPLPFADPDRLVRVNARMEAGVGLRNMAYLDFRDCQRQSATLELGGLLWDTATLSAPGDPEHLVHASVSANLFPMLGVRMIEGREFTPEEDRAGASGVAILSESLWRRRFGATAASLGSTIVLDTRTYTVIGVAPASFRPDDQIDIYTPLAQNTLAILARRGPTPIRVTGRLRPGATLEQARGELGGFAGTLAATYPDSNKTRTFVVNELRPEVGDVGGTLWLLFGAVVAVLLIACVNIANLLLARALTRERELALRVALGAGRGRLIRQCLTESVVLGVGGGLLGVFVAWIGLRPFVAMWPGSLPRASEIALDGPVLLFALGVSVASGLAFGLAPALGAPTRHVERTIRASGRGVTGQSRRLQGAFIVVEVALAMVLLACASLLGRTLLRVSSLDPGVDVYNVLTARAAISPTKLRDPAAAREAWRDLLDQARRVPGVAAIAMVDTVPLRQGNNQIGYRTSAAPVLENQQPTALATSVTPEYLAVTGLTLRAGRFFTDADRLGTESVTVIDDVLAEQAFGGQSPLGRKLWIDLGNDPATVIGVVGHVRYWGLAADDQSQVRAQLYYPFAQVPDQFVWRWSQLMSIAVRTEIDPSAVLGPLRRAVVGDTRDQVLYQVRTLEELAGASVAPQRFLLWLFGVFAAMAIALACIGIYGVVAYLTSQRLPEIGVRMALGASAGGVRWLVLRQSLGLISMGLVIGGAGAMAADVVLSRLVQGVQPAGAASIAVAAPVLVLAALAASLIPAERASRVDPAIVLK